MVADLAPKVEFLKQVQLFKGLDEPALLEIAGQLDDHYLPAGQVLFHQGDPGNFFYIIVQGEVRVTHHEDGRERQLALFTVGDSLGEEALLFDQPRSATITTVADTSFYRLGRAKFNRMLEQYPEILPLLRVYAASHQKARRYRFRWQGENEIIAMIDRRHPIRLVIELAGVAVLVSALLTGIVAIGWLAGMVQALDPVIDFLWGLTGFVLLLGLIVAIWALFEWLNDFFVVTNIRVVWRERHLLRRSSLQEAPLRQIQALDAQTGNFIERILKVGTVTVRTFTSTLEMTDVRHPQQMVAIIEDYLRHARQRKQQVEIEQIRHTIRQQLGFADEETELPVLKEEEQLPVVSDVRVISLNPFKNRVQEGKVITYRKHWSNFLGHAWLPSLLLPMTCVVTFVFLVSASNWLPALLLGGLIFFGVAVWWGYHYFDWMNDLYQLTEDRIIDREKKPLGKESTRSASLGKIQSLGHEIPNLLNLILKVGTVSINVGDDTFDFVGVYDPALVQNDISRYMEELERRQEQARQEQERKRMATWLEIYHEEAEQQRRSERRWDFSDRV